GITYGLIYEQLLIATLLIASVAFILSYIGSTFGKTLGHMIGNKANIFGGIMIILLGVKALFS
ncbi:MAG: manganese efflux pump, partial [Turicibacter sp.]|nr:manganese efflux pump [Turicibacter sp.]